MKLHLFSVPYRIAQTFPRIIGPLVFVVFLGERFIPTIIIPGAIVLIFGSLILVGAWHIAYYRHFEYRSTTNTFDIRSGVISRRNREIPYRRIQNVDISRSLVQRLLGLAEVRLETAGGGESEAHLRYVGYEEAKRLQNEIRSRTREIDESSAGTAEQTTRNEGRVLYRISPRDLVILAVASFDLRVVSILLVGLSFTAPSAIIEFVRSVPIDPLAIIVATGLFVGILSAILSGGSAVINNWGFELKQVGDELRYERGLLQRYDGSIPVGKVQTLVIEENLPMRLLEYASLTVETAGYAPGQGSESARAVPISNRENTYSIAKGIDDFAAGRFKRPAPQARWRYGWQYLIGVALLIALAGGVARFADQAIAWWSLIALLPLIPVAAHLKWVNRGYRLEKDHLLVRRGFWRRRTHVVPYYRIQTLDEVQTIIQARWQIASVIIDTAGRSGIVGSEPAALDLTDSDARKLHQELSAALQTELADRKRHQQLRHHPEWNGVSDPNQK